MATNKFNPVFRAMIHAAARKCFGHLEVTTYRTGFKVLKNRRSGPIIADHYMPNMEGKVRRLVPEFLSEQEERDAEAKLRRKRRGIITPKKGQGKRASKGKKKTASAPASSDGASASTAAAASSSGKKAVGGGGGGGAAGKKK